MGFLLDIIIPREEISNIDLNEQLIEWGNETFSYTPSRYIGNSNLVFEQVPDLKYYSKMLGEDLDIKEYIALILKGEELLDLEFAINRKTDEIENNTLLIFLEELIKLRKFYVFLLREDELVKKKYVVRRKDEVKTILCNCLNWSTQNDVLIVKG